MQWFNGFVQCLSKGTNERDFEWNVGEFQACAHCFHVFKSWNTAWADSGKKWGEFDFKNRLTPLSLVVYYSGENKENKIESRMQSLPITEQLLLSNGANINLKKINPDFFYKLQEHHITLHVGISLLNFNLSQAMVV